jgi:ketosteroid isomerase-like protein
MQQPKMSDAETNVWETVVEMNRCWTKKGTPDALSRYFHPDMVAICAGVKEPIVGGDACVAGWKDFSARAANLRFVERNPFVRLVGDTAIVAYDFTCSYEMDGRAVAMAGRDLFTLVKAGEGWQVIADHFSPMPD